MRSKLKVLSMFVIIISMVCFAPTVFAYKTGDIAGTIGSGTYESPVRCDNFFELKQALENNDIKYVRLDGNFQEAIPVETDTNLGSGTTNAIKVSSEKHLILNGDASFYVPNFDTNKYKTIVNLLYVTSNFEIKGEGSLTFRAFSNNASNAVVYNGCGTGKTCTIQDGVDLIGSFNTESFGVAIWQQTGNLVINGGTFTGENAVNNEKACAVVINGGDTFIYDGEFRAYNKGSASSTLYGVDVYNKDASMEIRGGKFHDFRVPSGKILEDYVVTSEANIVYETGGAKQKILKTFTVVPKLQFTIQPQGGTAFVDNAYEVTFKLSEEPSVVKIERLRDDNTWIEISGAGATNASISGYPDSTHMIYRVVARSGSNETISKEFTVIWKESKRFTELPTGDTLPIDKNCVLTWKLSFEPDVIRIERLKEDGNWTFYQGASNTGATINTLHVERTDTYRVVAISNGEEIISNEFQVIWKGSSDTKPEQPEQLTEIPTEQPSETTEKQENDRTWIKASKWALTELDKASEENLIPWIFEKEDLTVNITRREFAYVAVKLYEKITNVKLVEAKENPFTDTEDIEVLKAYNIGITNGTSATTFTPDALITREQMATMMTRALTKAGIDTKVDLNKVSKFADDSEMHDWGKASIYYMSNVEIIKGVGNNIFDVEGNATREQALLISVRSATKFSH